MGQITQEDISTRLSELPAPVREAVLSADLGLKLHAISQDLGLHIDQTAAMEDETYATMLGFFTADDFEARLQTALHVDEQKAHAVAERINNDVFLSIREYMKGKANPVATPKPLSQPAAVSAPASLPPLTPADHMLTSTTVSMPPPPKPQDTQPTLSVDPYREPIE